MKILPLLISIGLFLFINADVRAQTDENLLKKIESLSYFTTGIFNNDSIDNIREITIDAERVFHYFELSGLEDRPYTQAVAIYDGMGDLVTEKAEIVFKPKNGKYRTWFYYDFNEEDAPGLWRFVVEFDGRHMMEQRLDVLATSEK